MTNISQKLRNIYDFGQISNRNFVYTGVHIYQNKKKEIFIDQTEFIQDMTIFQYRKQMSDNFLDRDDNRLLRKTVGQLSWAASQTRPDLAFPALDLSTRLNHAKYSDAKLSIKILKQAKLKPLELKYAYLGEIEDLHIEVFSDASLGNAEFKLETKSVMGYIIFLCNSSNQVSPIHWKSKLIERVAQDVKTAETLALEKAVDDAVYISNMITEIYFGGEGEYKIPINVNIDSKSLLDSIFSTKKVQHKTMRVVISNLQQLVKNKVITKISHVPSKEQLADAFTKKGAYTTHLLECLSKGTVDEQEKDEEGRE